MEGLGPTADRKYFVNNAREWRRLDGVGMGKQEGIQLPWTGKWTWKPSRVGSADWGLEEAILQRIYSQEPIRYMCKDIYPFIDGKL